MHAFRAFKCFTVCSKSSWLRPNSARTPSTTFPLEEDIFFFHCKPTRPLPLKTLTFYDTCSCILIFVFSFSFGKWITIRWSQREWGRLVERWTSFWIGVPSNMWIGYFQSSEQICHLTFWEHKNIITLLLQDRSFYRSGIFVFAFFAVKTTLSSCPDHFVSSPNLQNGI